MPTLIFVILLVIILGGMLLFGGCSDSHPEFYSIEKDCLIVKHEKKNGTIYKCYETHEAYAVHEGLHLDHAKQRFNGFKREAMKIKEINNRIDDSNTFIRSSPEPKNRIDSTNATEESSRQ